jgi:lipoprotein NlpD
MILHPAFKVPAAALFALALVACAAQRPAPVDDRTSRAGRALPQPAAQALPQRAPVAASPSASSDTPEGHYVVKKGDTLYSIALDNGADYREVAQWNSLDDPTKLRVGQVLRVTAQPQAGVTIAAARGIGAPEAKAIGSPSSGVAATPAATAPPKTAQPEPRRSVGDGGALGEFIWPAKGKVLAGFGEPRSKGIDIDGKLGDPVIAAAAGRVTYIGSGIPGLGKLVVIRHDNGFITVYAHNRSILVKEQQSVARGQRIAELGNSDAERPKLHFQIRKGSAPVDPMRYLPAS